jgi:CubicO group peptidase (beta-lactamase class C family)
MHKRISILLLTIGVAIVLADAAATAIHDPDFDVRNESPQLQLNFTRRDSAGLDSLIQEKMSANHIPGIATIGLKNGEIVWNRSYGYAVIEGNIPVADSTLFYLASVSKTSVAIVFMQLWEQHLFGLDDDVGTHLGFPVRNPYYPDSVISIRMCMTHMSSINDNFNILGPLNIQGDSPIPLGEFLEDYLVPGGIYYSTDNYNPWPPATQDDYCNIGAAICGYIVEQLADSFPLRCRNSLFDPLSMNETAWFIAELDTSNIAMPYHWDGNVYVPYGHIGKPYYPCGTLRTSSLQLSRLLTAFMQHGVIDDTVRILDSATVDSITTSQYPVLNPEQGLFWYKKFLDGRWIWGHQGWFDGVRTRVAFDWDSNTGAVVLSNGEDMNSVTEITIALLNYASQCNVDKTDNSVLLPRVSLRQNHPNPFSNSTKIGFTLARPGYVTLTFYNILGQEVARLIDGELVAGEHSIMWDVSGLPSGVYYYRLTTRDQSKTRSCLLLK